MTQTHAPASPGPGADERAIDRQVRWTMELFNPLAEELQDQSLFFYAPAELTPSQRLEALQVSLPSSRLTDPLGHTIVRLHFPRFAPLARRTFTVLADLRMDHAPRAAPLADPAAWTGAERYIEVMHSRIQALARELRRHDDRDTARAIYDWVRGNLSYAGYTADDFGAADALTRQRGDCTEYAYLVVALARANGLPARMVGGHDVDRNSVLRAEEYHNWAELYFDGRWNLVDAQKERWLGASERYVVFRYYRDAVINPIGLAHRYVVRGALQARL